MNPHPNLHQMKCQPCRKGVKAYSKKKAVSLLTQLEGWRLSRRGDSISKEYRMKNFMDALRFINLIAKVAEKDNHHPDLHLTGYRKLKIVLSTHAIGGLSENDFILAAKFDKISS